MKSVIYADFMNYHTIIIENTQIQYFDNLIPSSGKKMYASVHNNEDMIMHQVYKYLVYCYIHWTYTVFCQNNEMETRSIFKKEDKRRKLADKSWHVFNIIIGVLKTKPNFYYRNFDSVLVRVTLYSMYVGYEADI